MLPPKTWTCHDWKGPVLNDNGIQTNGGNVIAGVVYRGGS